MNPTYPITALLASLTLVPLVRYLAPRIGAMDDPGALSVHELPTIQPADETPWIPGMCGAIEIPFGDDEIGFIQWEDNFLVTESGVEVLSKLPREIFLTG